MHSSSSSTISSSSSKGREKEKEKKGGSVGGGRGGGGDAQKKKGGAKENEDELNEELIETLRARVRESGYHRPKTEGSQTSSVLTEEGETSPGGTASPARAQLDEEELRIREMLGLPTGFTSTKGIHVQGNVDGTAKITQSSRKYRQYMNRRGGFNQPLEPEIKQRK